MARDILPHNATLPALPSVGQERVLAALLGGATVTAAARSADVDRATVHRWLSDDPAFIAAYNSYRLEMVDSVRQEVRFLAADAVKALRSVLSDGSAPAAVKLKAAGEVLKLIFDETPIGPTNVEDVEAAMKKRELDRRLTRRSDRLT